MSDISAQGMEKMRMKLMRWVQIAPDEVRKVLLRAGEMVRREAQLHHLSGPKMPRGVGDPVNATLAVRTGFLRRSIAIRVRASKDEISAEVGSSLKYARRHELGLAGMPARPFLRPSLNKHHLAIFEMIDKAYFQAYGKH